jgi:predicted cupin superfamily sugar epimerase
MNKPESIIRDLELVSHPEGGWFRETYRSSLQVPFNSSENEFFGNRAVSTCIYFLLTSGSFSAFHRIRQDEIWHFYDGYPLALHMINSAGEHSVSIIGRDFERGEVPQFVVPAGNWFAAEVNAANGFSLVGCTVAPGFDFKDFELGDRKELLAHYPTHNNVIEKLTRE